MATTTERTGVTQVSLEWRYSSAIENIMTNGSDIAVEMVRFSHRFSRDSTDLWWCRATTGRCGRTEPSSRTKTQSSIRGYVWRVQGENTRYASVRTDGMSLGGIQISIKTGILEEA